MEIIAKWILLGMYIYIYNNYPTIVVTYSGIYGYTNVQVFLFMMFSMFISRLILMCMSRLILMLISRLNSLFISRLDLMFIARLS